MQHEDRGNIWIPSFANWYYPDDEISFSGFQGFQPYMCYYQDLTNTLIVHCNYHVKLLS